jgi:hypothetical protein
VPKSPAKSHEPRWATYNLNTLEFSTYEDEQAAREDLDSIADSYISEFGEVGEPVILFKAVARMVDSSWEEKPSTTHKVEVI